MRILVTGATGYIGSAVARVLLDAGYEVTGLARSEDAAGKLKAAGVQPCQGDLADPASLAAGAHAAAGVVHAAMAWGPRAGTLDAAAVAALLDAFAGTGKPLIYTSGCWVFGSTLGRLAGEMFRLDPPALVAWRPSVERAVLDAGERRVCGVVIRPATVYGRGGGTPGRMVRQARDTGVVSIVGEGANHWSFVSVDDLADLYRLALEKAPAGSLYVAADGPPIPVRRIAEAAAAASGRADVRVEPLTMESARATMGPIADCLALDSRVGSTRAGRELGWKPHRPGVLDLLARGYPES